MNALERKKQLEELGVEIPKENMEQLQREMAAMAKRNYQMMVQQNEERHSRDELLAMKKLGLSAEEINKLDPGENPFLDHELGEMTDIGVVIQLQNQFHDQLKLYYKMRRDQIVADAEVAHAAVNNEGTFDDLEEQPDLRNWPDLEPPPEFKTWNQKKQLVFEHNVLKKLREFLKDVKYDVKRGKITECFLHNYTRGQVYIFEDLMKRMIESKGAEAYEIVVQNDANEINESEYQSEENAATPEEEKRRREEEERQKRLQHEKEKDPKAKEPAKPKEREKPTLRNQAAVVHITVDPN